MEIKETIDISDIPVAGIVARVQVDDLHDGHRDIFDFVMARHKKVILFLGVPTKQNTIENPLDYATRYSMIRETYPEHELVIQSLPDQNDNEIWSRLLDSFIPVSFGDAKAVLYGSRDSFIP